MLPRERYLSALATAIKRSPICALLGPRQCGKTTLARMLDKQQAAHFFDLESEVDRRRLQNPELMLGSLSGLVVLDEIQYVPELFSVLRILADRQQSQTRFLILGSASPQRKRLANYIFSGLRRLLMMIPPYINRQGLHHESELIEKRDGPPALA